MVEQRDKDLFSSSSVENMFEDADESFAGSKQEQEKVQEKKVGPVEKKYSNEQYLSINTIVQKSEKAKFKRERDKKLNINDDMDLSFDSAALRAVSKTQNVDTAIP